MITISEKDILAIHQLIIEQSGGSHGLRDAGLLNSAVNAPFQTFEGKDLYDSIEEKAAHLGYSLVNNHPFIDGNKRVGILAMATFLEINGCILYCSDGEIVSLGLSLADGSCSIDNLITWLQEHLNKK